MTNPLERLLVDSAEVDAEMLATVLEPYVRIDAKSKEIRGTRAWGELSTSQRILAGLLARRALAALSMIGEDEVPLRPQALERVTGVRGPTLRKELSRLYADRLIQKDDRRYFIPGYSIDSAQAALERRRAKA